MPKALPGHSGGKLPGRSKAEKGKGKEEQGKESQEEQMRNGLKNQEIPDSEMGEDCWARIFS